MSEPILMFPFYLIADASHVIPFQFGPVIVVGFFVFFFYNFVNTYDQFILIFLSLLRVTSSVIQSVLKI